MRRYPFVLITLLIAVLMSSCGHSLKRERLYGRNGWRVGPYEIIVNPKVAVDSHNKIDYSRITGAVLTIYQRIDSIPGSGQTDIDVEIDSVVVLLSDHYAMPIDIMVDSSYRSSDNAKQIIVSRIHFDLDGSEPLAEGGCIEYTLRQRDKSTGRILHQEREMDCFYLREGSFGTYTTPFAPIFKVMTRIPQDGKYNVTIYNIDKEVVARLTGTGLKDEYITLDWNGTEVPNGLYFCEMESGEFTDTTKVFLMR